MKTTNKKILLSLSVLATPFVVESFTDNTAYANGQYTLKADTKTYATASNAVTGKSASATYTKGNYYVYKQANGMINISKTPGKPGAWINPNTNTVSAAPSTSRTTVAKTPEKTSVIPQTQTRPTQSVATSTNNSTYTLSSPTKTYATAANASKRVGATATYQRGTYHVYKNYNGMLNISRVQGRAGAWINPAEVKAPATITQQIKPVVTTPKQTQNNTTTSRPTPATTTTSNQYVLNRDVKVYASAANAKQGVGARTTYKAGNYYIFRRSGDMLNISRVVGKAGAWINPAENTTSAVSVATKPTPVSTVSTPKTNTTNNEKVVTTSTNTKNTGSYVLNNDVATYSNAGNAASRSNARSTYKKGTYFIYKTVNGMYNISSVKGKAGAWINPTDNKIITSFSKTEENKKQTKPSNLTDSPIAPVSRNPITSTKYATANKIYSVMSEFGLNKYQIAGMLGNFEAEANVNPGIFEAYFRPSVKANARQLAEKNGPTVENLFEGGWEQFKSDYAARGIELTEKGYDYTGTGVHWLGVGLGQWTGPASKGLWEFSKSRGMSMWSVDTQLAYMLSKLPGDVSLYNRLVTFKGMPATSAVQGADNFSKEWERNVKNLATQKRRDEADKWLAQLSKMNVDRNYARTIMSKAIK